MGIYNHMWAHKYDYFHPKVSSSSSVFKFVELNSKSQWQDDPNGLRDGFHSVESEATTIEYSLLCEIKLWVWIVAVTSAPDVKAQEVGRNLISPSLLLILQKKEEMFDLT